MKSTPRRSRRRRQTTRGVRFADHAARLLISAGGIGTIVAVTTLCVFLVWVVVPLFLPARIESRESLDLGDGAAPLAIGLDEYLNLAWAVEPSGEVRCLRLEARTELDRRTPFGEDTPSVLAFAPQGGSFAAGFADGTLRTGAVGFATRFVPLEEMPEPLRTLAPGETAAMGEGVVERTTGDQFRLQELSVSVSEPFASGADGAIRLLDHVDTPGGPLLASIDADHVLRVSRTRRKTNLLTGEETLSVVGGELALDFEAAGGEPGWLLLTGLGDNAFLLWPNGTLWRCDARDTNAIEVVEKTNLFTADEPLEGGVHVTAVTFLLGRSSLAVGDSHGRVHVCFRTKPANAGTSDGIETARAHLLGNEGVPVTALGPSARTRTLAVGYADGRVADFHVTSARELAAIPADPGRAPVGALAIAPKEDGLLVWSRQGGSLWTLDAPHPEAGLAALFTPVWYEGYAGPEHVWQSSSGTDDFEPKYGLVPLVFGTIKATLYSLLFGVPIALLAAVYTSEFLHPRTKARLKPLIEMMASLPSVVLGFLSALVIAPLVEDVVPAVLLSLVLVPFSACLGGALWRVLPSGFAIRLERARLLVVAAVLVLALGLSFVAGPLVERWLYGGDMRQWLNGSAGGGTGGWVILLFPLCVLLTAWIVIQHANPRLIRFARSMSRERFALLDLAKYVVAAGVCVLLALALGGLLARAGFDPRGGVLGTYVQRNALVVGFMMGFAIIPIIYTIAEDALSAVPDHLRAASLGAGATPWQTTVRVVVPTAMSGIFSAIMIGFGRAVGETMIVLMAAGNTPILDWNIFNGFRTLSANIAFELPEAVRGSTHYRLLFLAALVLFAMTFVLNTVAEMVRLRYRRRRVQL